MLVVAFLVGVLAATLWMRSGNLWQQHLNQAHFAGQSLYNALEYGSTLPDGIELLPADAASQELANQGEFEQLTGVPHPPLVTQLTVRSNPLAVSSSATLKLAIISSGLNYPLSELAVSEDHSGQDTVGEVAALLATYCSDAVIFAQVENQQWQKIEGPDIWSCKASPRDDRLPAGFLAVLGLIFLSGAAGVVASQFNDFSEQLKAQQRLGGAGELKVKGPAELQSIVEAINKYRELERKHLSERALVLSGVSHDLGTPATRLKLRAALISDADLRHKFEADIDQMTGIIESVLTYTRAELSTEEPRKISLSSLVDSLVADYADVGQPVTLASTDAVVIDGGQSIFMSQRGKAQISGDVQVIIQARPIALQRALSNLIDNALKYGRRATVSLETSSSFAHILVEDEGGETSTSDLENMVSPFKRGDNASPIEGFGMGLTIASTVAIEHGGSLTFEPGRSGAIAKFSISRD